MAIKFNVWVFDNDIDDDEVAHLCAVFGVDREFIIGYNPLSDEVAYKDVQMFVEDCPLRAALVIHSRGEEEIEIKKNNSK